MYELNVLLNVKIIMLSGRAVNVCMQHVRQI